MTEIQFYHVERGAVEDILPVMLERSLDRGWNAVVQARSPERLARLDEFLWSYSAEAFIPHGTAADGDAEAQPVYLTTGEENPNEAHVRFLIEGAQMMPALQAAPEPYGRVVLVFNGGDPDELADARVQWKTLKAAGLDCQYWQQDEDGKWRKKG